MAKTYESLTPDIKEFIIEQKIFFTASAPLNGGRVNLSPKGMDTLRIINDNCVAYLDLTGSGNETAAHIKENGRLTFMFCSFSDKPMILRLYGKGDVVFANSKNWQEIHSHFEYIPGERQIIVLHVEMIQTSCGFGVPLMEFLEERSTLRKFAENSGTEFIKQVHKKYNQISIDGLPTGLPID